MNSKLGQYQRIEVGFDLDNFRKPIAYSGAAAWVKQVMQLCFFDPGTIASNPTFGIGIRRYDFQLEDHRQILANEINRQVSLAFPDMPFNRCDVWSVDDETERDTLTMTLQFYSVEAPAVVVSVRKDWKYIDFYIKM